MEHNYIDISEDRLHHMLGVARKAYTIALESGYDETFAKKMFVIGFNHDIGQEFAESKESHSMVSALLLTNTFATGNIITDGDAMNSIDAILYHGSYPEEETEEWIILNQADMLVGPDGKDMSIAERLEDIKERYGEYSDDYLTACDIAYRIGLTAINPT